MMDILLTGGNGQLGFELQRALAPLGRVHAVDVADCDLADATALRTLVRAIRPEVIVNPAAYTAVDKAESEPGLAQAINAIAPGVLGEEAAQLGAWVVHYSTDYVFDGAKAEPYAEDDAAHPHSIYGASKLAGELALRQSGARHLILRTSWLLGAHGGNFARTILRLAAERDQLSVVADQIGAPTTAALVADVTAHLLRQASREGADAFPFGLYHLTAAGATSWHDYARFVVSEARALGARLRLEPSAILAIDTAGYPTAARRPANSRLDTSRLHRTFGLHLPDWQDGVRHTLQQILDAS